MAALLAQQPHKSPAANFFLKVTQFVGGPKPPTATTSARHSASSLKKLEINFFDEFGFGRSVHADADHANNHRHNRGNEQRYLCSQRHALSRAT